MPTNFIGGFVDLQLDIWLDASEGDDEFELMSIIAGARSQPFPMLMAELGIMIPVAGDVADHEDIGLGLRIAATPDFL